jgi:hypothetical protein
LDELGYLPLEKRSAHLLFQRGARRYNHAMTPVATEVVPDRRAWWGRRRLRYNFGLAAAGILAFVAYVAVIFLAPEETLTPPGGEPPDVNGLTTAFQAFGYLVAMGVANICYGLGSLAERLIRPEDVMRFRRRAFAAGFAFSVALPFAIPVTVLVMVVSATYHR